MQRQGQIRLDLSKHELLTDPDVIDVPSIKAGGHFIRSGDADPRTLAHGAHPQGEPLRIAQDMISGKYFVQIALHRPTEMDTPRAERQHAKFEELRPYHVAGNGYWVPLDELYPEHPHSEIFNGVAQNPVYQAKRARQAVEAAKARAAAAVAAAQEADAQVKELEARAAKFDA